MDYLQAFSLSIITNLQVLNPWILTTVATLLFWEILSYRNSGAWKLRKFPTVGSALPTLSLIGKINFMKNAHNIVATGRRKWPGRIFKIPSPMGWQVVITDPTHIDDLRKAPEHILSANKVIEEILQSRFTIDRHVQNQIHFPIIRTRLTKEIPGLVADVYEEVVDACNQYLPFEDEWTSVMAAESMMTIVARSANRVFVGPVLCTNPEWIRLCIEFTIDVVKTALLLHPFPAFLRPIVAYVAGGKLARCHRDGLELLRPFIAARRDEKREEKSESFNDYLSWLIDESKGEDRADSPIAARMLGLSFVAIQTSSMAVTQALLDLASNPEYLKPLREEVEEVTKREGWTKAALDQMRKVDSFLKESQRVNPVGVLLMSRYALVDYTFSDGTFIPAGTVLTVSSNSVHLDPRTFEDALTFDGFRFIKMKERAAVDGRPNRKFDVVTINSDFVAFGQGRHACPGRFFASAEIKILLAYIVKTYDVKLVDDARPMNVSRINAILPNPAAKVYFRRRQ